MGLGLCPVGIEHGILLALTHFVFDSYAQESTPSPEPYYGAFVGSLPDPSNIGVKGDVYIVNMTTIQVIGFRYSGGASDLYFWLDKSASLTEEGYKIITFEFGDQPLKQLEKDQVVLWSPDAYVNTFQTFGLWSESQKDSYSSITIPKTLHLPSVQFLTEELRPTDAGRRYHVYSGPIMIMDRRRLKVFGFTFDTVRAPRTHFYVGRGLEPKMSHGKPVAVRGFESPNYIPAIQHTYTGDQDIILELPEDYDIYHIDWLSVYCTQFNIDFGHVKIGSDISPTIPPFVPLQRKHHAQPMPHETHNEKEPPVKPSWPINVLSGRTRRQFTFQLGPPGFDRSYGKWARAEPANWLWYVNGYMTPQIWLQRGVTYSFTVEGGDRPNEYGQVNALYITNTSTGGYGVQPDYERNGATIFAGLKHGKPLNEPSGRSFGRDCRWIPRDPAASNPEMYDSFITFKKTLRLKCEEGKTGGTFHWTPDKSTPGIVYYQSYAAPHMGFEILIVDEIPPDLLDGPDVHTEDTGHSAGTDESLETEEAENEDISVEGPLGSYEEDSRSGTRRESSSTGNGGSARYQNGDSADGRRRTKSGAAGFWSASSKSFRMASIAFFLSLVHHWTYCFFFVATR